MSKAISRYILIVCTCLTGFITSCRSPNAPTIAHEGEKRITISYVDTVGIFGYPRHPFVRASINGVSGWFLIDTGSETPILGIEAARRCKFNVFWPPETDRTNTFWGESIRMMKATNIVAQLAPGVTVHWPEVLVSGETNFFGIVDYRTLKAANAVIDTRSKTITFTK
jgi:hypothetical protein